MSSQKFGSKLVKASALPPQFQLFVVLGLQYAVLAKKVNGLKAEI